MESLEISKRLLIINKEDSARLSTTWLPAYDILKPKQKMDAAQSGGFEQSELHVYAGRAAAGRLWKFV